MNQDLVYHPDPRLRAVCDPVTRVDPKVQQLMRDLVDTMLHGDRGVGLAAPQIGRMERVIAIDTRKEGEQFLMANPEIVWMSGDSKVWKEGCMSIPEVFADVTRPDRIRVRYIDADNEPRELEAGDLLSVVIQHEIDHLNGVLFIDHLSRLKRDMLLRRYNKIIRVKE